MGLLDLSVVIPARNESASLAGMLHGLFAYQHHPREVIVVNDHSTDQTEAVAWKARQTHLQIQVVNNLGVAGYGSAIRCGLTAATSQWVTIMTADGSDSLLDLLAMYFVRDSAAMIVGDRWGKQGQAEGYPVVKAWMNRAGNTWIARKVGTTYADWTNPFKLYRRADVDAVLPGCVETGMSAGLELALRMWTHQNGFAVVPHHWQERTAGRSKFDLIRTTREYVRTVRRVLG